MQPDTIFWIASMTKPITAPQCSCSRTKASCPSTTWSRNTCRNSRDLKTADGKPARVTIRHLLTHTSGMGEITGDEARASRTLAGRSPSTSPSRLRFEPGTKWVYCQSGINTAGTDRRSGVGQALRRVPRARMFGPLGMKDTTFYLTESTASAARHVRIAAPTRANSSRVTIVYSAR